MANRDLIGQQLGSYRLISEIWRGAISNVYLGEHIHLGTKAAVKVLGIELTSDHHVELFHQDARARASLIHPNIVRVLDFGVEGQMPFLILEYAPNGTLGDLYRNRAPVSPTTMLPHVKHIASALQYGHIRGFIHGQVMPRNMLLNHNNEVLLDHFRFSFSVIDNERGVFMETPLYVAPEQFHGQLLPATDQYALGLSVYEWLTGRRPFDGGTSVDMMVKCLIAEPPSLRAIIPVNGQ
jgi:eukaryotic-like serine/threonine-protein kinase